MPKTTVDQKLLDEMLAAAGDYMELLKSWKDAATSGAVAGIPEIEITGVGQVHSAAVRLLKLARKYDGHFTNWRADAAARGADLHAKKPNRRK